ncbi:MAG: hypothetical protein M0C28_16965 [Candidatus Moduliflexus flocculans]|nr:hypothetical protein [Candidatus Moduliflexus flocculans]
MVTLLTAGVLSSGGYLWSRYQFSSLLTHSKAPIIKRVRAILAAPGSPDVPRLEAEIDRLVYDLCGLTPEEIAIVEWKK